MPCPGHHAPIEDLPLEILIGIFDLSILSQCTSDAGSQRQGDVGAAKRTSLRGVSQTWNRIILNDPRYWNHITLDLREIHHDQLDKLIAGYDWVRQCMQRSEHLPRHLRLIDPGEPCDDDDDDDEDELCLPGCCETVEYDTLPGLREFLQSTREEWTSAYISMEHHHLLPADIFGDRFGIQYAWSALRSLTLTSTAVAWPTREDGALVKTDFLWMDAEHFPALRELCIKMPFCAMENWTFPWAQLTRLELDGLYDELDAYLQVLGESSSLEVFRLALPVRDGLWDQCALYPQSPVTVPHLREVELDVPSRDPPAAGGKLFDKLTLPTLQALTLKGRIEEEAFCKSFLCMLDRSRRDGCCLHLDFEGSNVSADVVGRIMGFECTHRRTIY